MRYTEEITAVLNKFHEVEWDRYSGDFDGIVRIYGWIRTNERKDFVLLDFEEGKIFDFITSAEDMNTEFSKRLGVHFSIDGTLKLEGQLQNEIKIYNNGREETVNIPISFINDKKNIVGIFKITKEWFDKLTPNHKLIINGRYTNRNQFKTMEITLIPTI